MTSDDRDHQSSNQAPPFEVIAESERARLVRLNLETLFDEHSPYQESADRLLAAARADDVDVIHVELDRLTDDPQMPVPMMTAMVSWLTAMMDHLQGGIERRLGSHETASFQLYDTGTGKFVSAADLASAEDDDAVVMARIAKLGEAIYDEQPEAVFAVLVDIFNEPNWAQHVVTALSVAAGSMTELPYGASSIDVQDDGRPSDLARLDAYQRMAADPEVIALPAHVDDIHFLLGGFDQMIALNDQWDLPTTLWAVERPPLLGYRLHPLRPAWMESITELVASVLGDRGLRDHLINNWRPDDFVGLIAVTEGWLDHSRCEHADHRRRDETRYIRFCDQTGDVITAVRKRTTDPDRPDRVGLIRDELAPQDRAALRQLTAALTTRP